MKKILITSLALSLSVLLINGCTKNAAPAPVITELTGTWRYIGYGGGFAGLRFMPVDTLENYIQVDTAGARIMFKSGTGQQCTTYTFEKNSNGSFGGLVTLKDTVFYNITKLDVYLSHDTLSVYPHNWADAFTSYYKISSAHFNWCASDAANNH